MNSREIGLFFDRKYIFDSLTIAEELKNNYPELGEVLIFPVDESKNTPVIIFEKNSDFNIFVSLQSINIKISEKYYNDVKKILTVVLNIFKKANVKFTRIGIINNVVLGDKEKMLFLNNVFEASDVIESKEFELAYYKLVNYESRELNLWKRFISNKDLFYVILDLNTKQEDTFEVTVKSAMSFIEFALDYMKNNQPVKVY